MIEAERGLLGCVLVDQSCLYDIYGKLEPEMFADEFCSDTYREMLVMYDCGQKINYMDLSFRMENHKYDADVVRNYLKQCLEECVVSIQAVHFADVIIREYKSRTVKELFSRVSLLPKDIDNTIAECLLKLESLQRSEEAGLKSMKQIVAENKDNYFTPNKKTSGIRLGLEKLDECLGDLALGDITIIAARPSVGKSALVSQVITSLSERRLKVGYFNLEMLESQVYERFLSNIGELSLPRIKNANAFLGDERERFEKANEKLESYDLFISSSRRISRIKAECRHQNFDVIVIDHLQLTQSDKKWNGNRNGEIGENSRELKALAMALKSHVILISQLNRAVEHRENKEPVMADLRECGDIEQDASNIIFIWNLSEDENCRSYKGVKIEKNRQGVLIKRGLKFMGEHMRFEESKSEFKEFKEEVKQREKGVGQFVSTNGEKTPFDKPRRLGEDW